VPGSHGSEEKEVEEVCLDIDLEKGGEAVHVVERIARGFLDDGRVRVLGSQPEGGGRVEHGVGARLIQPAARWRRRVLNRRH